MLLPLGCGALRYAVWITHLDGRLDEPAPRLVVTAAPLQFGDKLPLANVSCWITEVIDGEWADDAGRVYDARARAAAGPKRDPADDAE
jgi:hypothetical protein